MQRRCFHKSRYFIHSILQTGIFPVWIAGLALGFSTDRFYGDVYCGLFEMAPLCQPDFAGLAMVNLIPLLISAFAVLIFPGVVYILCLLRGILLGAGLLACVRIYAQAGPMMAVLTLFSLVLFSPVMLWYWSRVWNGDRSGFLADTLFCICAAMVLLWLDLCVIAPFLREIMIF